MSVMTTSRALRALVSEIEQTAPLAVEAYTAHASARDASRKLEGELLAAVLSELVESSTVRALAGPADYVDIISVAESAVRHSLGGVGLRVDVRGGMHTIENGPPYVQSIPIHISDAAQQFGLQTILDAIADKLDVAINSHPKSAIKVERYVAIVRACLVLLRKGIAPGER